ncbi:uncharacterized protein SOCEGT47_014200 [Sorangium cellulosum]|uniref:Uncharacterized protein n=1 Tax=Sorangium cellulosum TaxID=56 RepID=A0A4P2PWU5_SORCE|nr:hypothetical protein [Sorangium cellulosum]AUX20943.1 uncharacterized protein SOCEGT47_014200 [Sorangium cellulosum]
MIRTAAGEELQTGDVERDARWICTGPQGGLARASAGGGRPLFALHTEVLWA